MLRILHAYLFATNSALNNAIPTISTAAPTTLITRILFLDNIFPKSTKSNVPNTPPSVFPSKSVISLTPIENIHCIISKLKLIRNDAPIPFHHFLSPKCSKIYSCRNENKYIIYHFFYMHYRLNACFINEKESNLIVSNVDFFYSKCKFKQHKPS